MKTLIVVCMMLGSVTLSDAGVYNPPQYCECVGIGVKPNPTGPQIDIKKTIHNTEQEMRNWFVEFLQFVGR